MFDHLVFPVAVLSSSFKHFSFLAVLTLFVCMEACSLLMSPPLSIYICFYIAELCQFSVTIRTKCLWCLESQCCEIRSY
ncbi:hypothetical protein DKX38_022394 [Salix brachista]|uniref:Uncharacterized protein n=1 Tax=Salix brachista TaxID=2182728 RepID=A0A5N5K551_9ROSI|nr:hypothetical protein DKX38_022394 [Salix brachista]